jgi:hypothetical protein
MGLELVAKAVLATRRQSQSTVAGPSDVVWERGDGVDGVVSVLLLLLLALGGVGVEVLARLVVAGAVTIRPLVGVAQWNRDDRCGTVTIEKAWTDDHRAPVSLPRQTTATTTMSRYTH